MARYLVLQRSFIDYRLVEPGVEVEYSGKPDGNLQPLDEEAEAASAARVQELQDARVSAAQKKLLGDLL